MNLALWKPTKDPRIKLRNGNYWARFSVNGVRIERKLDTKNFSIALQLTEKLSAEIVLGKAGLDDGNPLLFKTAWPKFLKDKEIGRYTKLGRPRTIKEYSDFAQRYYFEFFGHFKLKNITTDLFSEYIDWVRENHPGVTRFMNHEKYLNGFLSWAFARGYIDKKPELYNPDKSNEEEFEPGILATDAQWKFILNFIPEVPANASGGRIPQAFEFQVYKKGLALTGMRSSELTQLKKDRIDWDKLLIRLKKSDTKTKQARDVPIHPDLVEDLRKQFDSSESEYLFPNRDDIDRPMSRDGFSRQWDNMRFHEDAPKGTDKLTPHDLRHTLATKLFADPTLNPMLVCKMLGMSMATALKHYIHFDESQLHLITERFRVL